MAKFKVGDKVNCAEYGNGVITKIITSVMPEIPYYVVFESGKELYLGAERLTLPITREFIVIHQNGNVMTAEHRVNRDVIKSAKATCSENDTFDLMVGAQIAFDKLTGRYVKPQKEPKPAPQPAHRFKVGDRVFIDPLGIFGIVERVDETDAVMPYHVKHEYNGYWWAKEHQLSPAPAHELPKFYTGKVVCVEWKGDIFRHKNAGRIAIITNGISDYDGWNRMSKRFESFSDLCSANTHGVFHEIKE